MSQKETKQIHFNNPQLLANGLKAKELVAIMARATGKTQGVLAPRISECLIHMPTSTAGIITATYKNFKTYVLGSLVSGWRSLGFKEWNKENGGHYTFGRNPNFKMPEFRVDDWTHIIHWYNGSICSLISQDREGIGAGMSMQSLHGDEAYQLKEDRLKEYTFPAMRGLLKYEDSIYYKMKTFTSSMPRTPDGYWLFKYEQKMDKDVIKYMFEIYCKILENNEIINDETKSESYRRQLFYENRTLQEILDSLRKISIHYMESDTFENFHMLGDSFFRDAKRDLPAHLFDSQILNLRPKGIELGRRFYGRLRDFHFYTDYDNVYFDKFALQLPNEDDNCLGDLDCNRHFRLILSIDYGGKINSMLVCQDKPNIDSFNVLKEFFSEQQEQEYIDHLVDKFANYYNPMVNRDIDLYDDVQGNKPMANSAETLRQRLKRLLESKGFNVFIRTGSTNPTHKDKWAFINDALHEKDIRVPKIRINEANCPHLKIALFNTPIKSVMGKLQKDKSGELSDSLDQKDAPHITDAFDYVYYQKYKSKSIEMGGMGDMVF